MDPNLKVIISGGVLLNECQKKVLHYASVLRLYLTFLAVFRTSLLLETQGIHYYANLKKTTFQNKTGRWKFQVEFLKF